MKRFRCVFHSPNGQSSLELDAEDSDAAVQLALLAVALADAWKIEVWCEGRVVHTAEPRGS